MVYFNSGIGKCLQHIVFCVTCLHLRHLGHVLCCSIMTNIVSRYVQSVPPIRRSGYTQLAVTKPSRSIPSLIMRTPLTCDCKATCAGLHANNAASKSNNKCFIMVVLIATN